MIKNFYEFGSMLLDSTFQVSPTSLRSREEVLAQDREFDEKKLVMGNFQGINFPVTFKHDRGRTLADILDTGHPSLYLISDRFKSVLDTNKFSGFKLYPVKIYTKRNEEIKGYQGFSVVGRCGPISYDKSEIIEKSLSPNGPTVKRLKGLHIGLDKWDGFDFFLPEGNLGPVVTQNVADILKKSCLTNVKLTNLEDYEIDEYILKILRKI